LTKFQDVILAVVILEEVVTIVPVLAATNPDGVTVINRLHHKVPLKITIKAVGTSGVPSKSPATNTVLVVTAAVHHKTANTAALGGSPTVDLTLTRSVDPLSRRNLWTLAVQLPINTLPIITGTSLLSRQNHVTMPVLHRTTNLLVPL
jgi:hypothetical protein